MLINVGQVPCGIILTSEVTGGTEPGMTKIRALVSAFLLAFLLMGFDAQEARDWINGQWQGRTQPWSLAVDSVGGTAIFINASKRVTGAFVIEEVVGRSIRFQIGSEQFTIHFHSKDEADMSVGNSEFAFRIERVK